MKIRSNTKDYASFLQKNYTTYYESIKYKALHEQKWQPFDIEKYIIPEFELARSDTDKRNFQFDFSSHPSPFYIFSENAVEALKDILETRGQFIPVITPSKRKKFVGYYPTNKIKGLVYLEKSGNYDLDRPFFTDNLFFKKEVVFDEYLFCIAESKNCVLITEKFKQRVVEAGLKGFDFFHSERIVTIE